MRDDLLHRFASGLSALLRLVDDGFGAFLGFRTYGLANIGAFIDDLLSALDRFFGDRLADVFGLVGYVAGFVLYPTRRIGDSFAGGVKSFFRGAQFTLFAVRSVSLRGRLAVARGHHSFRDARIVLERACFGTHAVFIRRSY